MKRIPFLYGILHGRVRELEDDTPVTREVIVHLPFPDPINGKFTALYVLKRVAIRSAVNDQYYEEYPIYEYDAKSEA